MISPRFVLRVRSLLVMLSLLGCFLTASALSLVLGPGTPVRAANSLQGRITETPFAVATSTPSPTQGTLTPTSTQGTLTPTPTPSPTLTATVSPTPTATQGVAPGTCGAIQQAIAALPPSGGVVHIAAGLYICTVPLVIDRDNVELRGDGPGTVLRLANGANAPVLVVGQILPVPNLTRRNIVVGDLVIDGNRLNQSSETSLAVPELRNNGISIRRAEDVRIERVTVRSARSGGLVTELGCRRLMVRDFSASDNFFDGLAGYETEDSLFMQLQLNNNVQGAGLSFDIRFNNNIISDAVMSGNAKVGIFMRDSRDNLFQGLQIRGSGEHGIFLAQVDGEPNTPASGNTFSGIVVSDSAGAGLRANDLSVVNTLVVGAQFIRNAGGCVSEAMANQVQQAGVICR